MDTFCCDGLYKSFDGINALADVSLEFPSRGITAIIGPNGAGKTTLINVLTGFHRPDKGRCFLEGRETTNLPPYSIAQFGVARTFQDLRLILQVTALENLLLARPQPRGERLLTALTRFGVPREEAINLEESMRLLRFAGLETKAEELAGELSFGQQKLLSLLCSIATNPQILILDEPVSGVHPQMISRITELMRQLRDKLKLIIFIEHNIAIVRQLADVVIVMDEGKIIAQGDPNEILEMPEIMEAYIA